MRSNQLQRNRIMRTIENRNTYRQLFNYVKESCERSLQCNLNIVPYSKWKKEFMAKEDEQFLALLDNIKLK